MGHDGEAADGPPEAVNGELQVRPAVSREELAEAYHLVYTTYLRRGYIGPNPARVRISSYNAFPSSVTFVAALRSHVIATVSLVPDTPVGLPMDEIYHDELQACRDAGRTVAEVTMLADRRFELRRSLPMLLRLMKLVFDHATLVLHANDLCITINPRHDSFYRRYLLFQGLGEQKSYPSVRDNPALAQRLDLDTVRQTCEGNERLLRHFYQNRTPVDLLTERYRMSPEDLRYFFVEQTSAFSESPADLIACLRGHYPDCPWEEWTAPSPDR